MAGARALWVANGMKREMIGKPIIAIVNSFTQFVPGHTHLHEIGQQVKAEIEKYIKESEKFNKTIVKCSIVELLHIINTIKSKNVKNIKKYTEIYWQYSIYVLKLELWK